MRTIEGIALDLESTSTPTRLADVAATGSEPDSAPPVEKLPPPENEPTTNAQGEPVQDAGPEVLPTPSPVRLDLSLADARAAALTSNLDLRVELVNPAIVRQAISQEAARFEATFNSSYVRNRLDLPPGFAAGGDPDTTLDIFSNSITQPLKTGGEVRALHDVTKTDVHGVPGPNAADTDLGVEYRQPLLRGFGYRVNTAGIQIARTQSGIADSRAKLTAIRVLADVERAYWQLYGARQFHEIAQQQLVLAERQLNGVRRLVAAGVFTTVEQLVAESGVLVRRDAAIRAETAVRLAERELKRIMQRPDAQVDMSTEIALVTEPNPLGLVFDRKNLADRALVNRMEMLELQLQLLATAIDIDFQRNSVLPQLDIVAEVDALGLGTAYRKSMDNLGEGEFGDRLIGLTLEVPLAGNIGARARLRAAQLRNLQTRLDQQRVSVLIIQEIYDAIDRVEQNWERIVATQQARVAAERAYEGQVRLQEAGRQTTTDVLVALTNLGESRAQEVQAVVDYQIAKVDLALAAGAMLGYGQVDWDPCCGALSPLPDAVRQQAAGDEPFLVMPESVLPALPAAPVQPILENPAASMEFLPN